MRPDVFYSTVTSLSIKFFGSSSSIILVCVAETGLKSSSGSRSGCSGCRARPAARAAPLQQQQQEDDDDDVRGADSPEWEALQSCKMQGNMTLLQLPDGDITICSATSIQSLGMFGGVSQSAVPRRLRKALTVTEMKHYWVWNHVFDPLIFYWWIFLLVVRPVGVINVQVGGVEVGSVV